MKRSQVKYIVITTIFIGLSYISYLTILQVKERKQIDKNILTLQNFTLQTIHGTAFNSSHINGPCLIIYFHPECEHCQYEAEQIRLNLDQLYNYHIIMIATASRESVYQFADNFYLTDIDNVSFLVDSSEVFQKTFGPNPVPTSFIYNSKKDLVKKFQGEVSLEVLMSFLN